VNASDIFGTIFGQVDTLGLAIVQSLYQALAGQLGQAFWAAATLWIIWWGYEMMWGKVGVTAGVFMTRVLKLMAIYTMAFQWATYGTLVATAFEKLPDSIANAVCSASGSTACGNGASGVAGNLDAIWSAAEAANLSISSQASYLSGWGLIILGYIILIVTGLMLVVAAGLIILTKIALYLLLALAPIYVSMALFQITSSMFNGWMTLLFQTGLVLPSIVYGILGVMIKVDQSFLTNLQQGSANGATPNMDLIGPFLLVAGASAYLLVRSESISHAIAGGARVDAMGFVNYFKRAAATAAGLGAVAAVSGVGIAAAAYRNHPNNPNNQTSPFAGNRSAALESAVREARS
jgi:type IV secretion system protein VirB6